MDEPPLVTVIMNCLNCEKYLKQAIDSVYAQTYTNWEIIFWDNASTDKSMAIAKSYEDRLRYFRGDQTIPVGAARNKALEQAKGGFIAFLDCDDLWMPEKLEKQIPLFDDPQVGLVFCDVIFFNDEGKTKQLYESRHYWTGHCFPHLLSHYFLSLPSVIIRKSALEHLEEWFDPRFNMIEEADLFTRIAYFWKLAMVQEPLAKWRVHGSSLTYAESNPLAEEMPLMLAKFHQIFPDFSQKFAKEIKRLKWQVSIDTALHHLRMGDNYRARSCLSQYKFLNLKTLLLFLITLFPMGFISFLYRLKSRLVVSSPMGNNL
jgi:glycosyltransferase involved in cell wall biosynthesis